MIWGVSLLVGLIDFLIGKNKTVKVGLKILIMAQREQI